MKVCALHSLICVTIDWMLRRCPFPRYDSLHDRNYTVISAYDAVLSCTPELSVGVIFRDVTDSESESNGIRHFFRNPKSDGYLKSDRVRFEIANCCVNSVNCRLPK